MSSIVQSIKMVSVAKFCLGTERCGQDDVNLQSQGVEKFSFLFWLCSTLEDTTEVKSSLMWSPLSCVFLVAVCTSRL